jgi:aspartate ammonia-lyase
MTLGQEFDGFHATIKEDVARLNEIVGLFREVNLGATAIGTGLNADPRYAALAVEELSRLSGQPMVLASNLIEATSDLGAFVLFSGTLKRVAVKLSKICNDLRLLSSGPRAGFGEIRLPAVQAGSSIMPGKVNPVIPEAVTQAALAAMGHDAVIAQASAYGSLELNAFLPLIADSLLTSLRLLTNANLLLRRLCVDGIEADEERCRAHVEASTAVATALVPEIGYDEACELVGRARAAKHTVREQAVAEGLLADEQFDTLLEPEAVLRLGTPGRQRRGATE